MYVRGWSYVMVWSEALKRADKAGQLNGPGVKAALETLKDFDLGGLSQPVTYTPTDHRPDHDRQHLPGPGRQAREDRRLHHAAHAGVARPVGRLHGEHRGRDLRVPPAAGEKPDARR